MMAALPPRLHAAVAPVTIHWGGGGGAVKHEHKAQVLGEHFLVYV